MTLIIESSDIIGEVKEQNLKLDIPKQYENSESLLMEEMSEAIQNESGSVKKDAIEGGSLNYFESVDRNSEILDFNMMVDLDEVDRKKLLVKLIGNQWCRKDKKFVNIH